MRWFAVLIALAASMAYPQDDGKANPGSLLAPGTANPFRDRVARQVGDILTVIVNEESVSEFAAKTTATKSDSASFSPTFFVDFLTRILRPFSASSNSSVKGDGKTEQSQKMSARLGVIVKALTPEGNLVVEGTRTIVTNKEDQTILVRGVVRPFDVRPDNTVLSEQLADAELRMVGKGLVADRQRRGLISTLMDWMF